MPSLPFVDINLFVHNGAATVAAAIDSVLAQTWPNLTLTPTSLRLKKQGCPFCSSAGDKFAGSKGSVRTAGAPAAAEPGGMLFLNQTAGNEGATVKVTDLDGNPIPGVVKLAAKNDNPNLTSIPPVVVIPSGVAFKATIDGSKTKRKVTTDLTYIGPGFDTYVDGINLDPGQVDTAEFRPAEGSITYETSRNEAPTIGAGFSGSGWPALATSIHDSSPFSQVWISFTATSPALAGGVKRAWKV